MKLVHIMRISQELVLTAQVNTVQISRVTMRAVKDTKEGKRMTKVVNLLGGPGAGKSTCASGLFYVMKKRGISCEMASEWIKEKLYEENRYVFNDQIYVFAKQRKKLIQLLKKVDYIITDSPLILSIIYGNSSNAFNSLVLEEFNRFDNINFVIHRAHEYRTDGRIQNSQEAQDISDEITKVLHQNGIKYTDVNSVDSVRAICGYLGISG